LKLTIHALIASISRKRAVSRRFLPEETFPNRTLKRGSRTGLRQADQLEESIPQL
jgi:hypothetical protein